MLVYVPLADNPRGVTIISVLWPMTALALVFLSLRIYTKILRSRLLWWDDYLIIFSWIALLVSCSATTANVRLGFGLTQMQVPFVNLVTFGLQSNTSGFMSVLSVVWSKTSFAITLLRLTDGWMKGFIIVLVIILNITQYLSAIFFWVSCTPPAKTWNPLLPGDCWPTSVTVNYSLFVGAFSAFSDFTLALLPWRLLLRYNMYNREKIGVAIAMSMGVFAGITCIIKMTTIPLLYRGDFSYNSLPLVLWGFIEPALTIVAASIPMMRHLFKSFHRDGDGTLPTLHMSTGVHDSLQDHHDHQQNSNHTSQSHRSHRSNRAAGGGRHLYQQHRDQLRGDGNDNQGGEQQEVGDENRSDASILAGERHKHQGFGTTLDGSDESGSATVGGEKGSVDGRSGSGRSRGENEKGGFEVEMETVGRR